MAYNKCESATPKSGEEEQSSFNSNNYKDCKKAAEYEGLKFTKNEKLHSAHSNLNESCIWFRKA